MAEFDERAMEKLTETGAARGGKRRWVEIHRQSGPPKIPRSYAPLPCSEKVIAAEEAFLLFNQLGNLSSYSV
jgi:hypothetical protein